MDNRETAALLERAGREIERQRRRLEVLEAVNRTVEIFGGALFAQSGANGTAPDIVWELDNEAANLRAKQPNAGGHTV